MLWMMNVVERTEGWKECCRFMSGHDRLSDKVIFLQKCQKKKKIAWNNKITYVPIQQKRVSCRKKASACRFEEIKCD